MFVSSTPKSDEEAQQHNRSTEIDAGGRLGPLSIKTLHYLSFHKLILMVGWCIASKIGMKTN